VTALARVLDDGVALGLGLGVVIDPVAFTNAHVAAPADVGDSVTIASTVGAEKAHAFTPDITVPTDSIPPRRDPVDRDLNVYSAGSLRPAVAMNDASEVGDDSRSITHTWPT
jgi:hypothetical protein